MKPSESGIEKSIRSTSTCRSVKSFDVDWTTLPEDRLVRTKSLPPIPQLDHAAAARPLEVQRKLARPIAVPV